MSEVVIDPASDLFITDPIKWFKGYRHFIFTEIVPRVLPLSNPNRDAYGQILISDQAMAIWQVSITHESVNRNPGSNNEMLEMLGDRELESIFSNYVTSLYPKMTEDLLTELKSTYMSKVKQRDMAIKLGLHKWTRTYFNVTIHTSEDLFESMFGALFKIGETYIGKGNGYALCNNLLANLYYDLKINPDDIFLRSRSQLKEIIEKLGWGKQIEQKFDEKEWGVIVPNITGDEDNEDENKWSLTLKLTKNARDFIKNVLGKEIINGGILATRIGKTKKNLINEASQDALNTLKDAYNIDFKWAVNYSKQQLENMITESTKIRMKQDGITSISFSKIFNADGKQMLQLIGQEANGNMVILMSVVASTKTRINLIKLFAVKSYSESGKFDPSKLIVYSE